MHIHALKLSVTERELNELAEVLPSGHSSVKNLQVRLISEGISVQGEYTALLMKMAFETLWEVKGLGSIVEARLASVKVAGVPASMLRSVLLKTLRDSLAQESGVRVEEESIYVDLCKLPALQKLRLNVHLTEVRCDPGVLLIEAGEAIA